jgi:hypothetical protein
VEEEAARVIRVIAEKAKPELSRERVGERETPKSCATTGESKSFSKKNCLAYRSYLRAGLRLETEDFARELKKKKKHTTRKRRRSRFPFP